MTATAEDWQDFWQDEAASFNPDLIADYIDPETVTEPEPPVMRTVTACNAKPACKRGCAQFVPGPIIGRDQGPSCLTCTHTRATHQPAKTPTKKAARR